MARLLLLSAWLLLLLLGPALIAEASGWNRFTGKFRSRSADTPPLHRPSTSPASSDSALRLHTSSIHFNQGMASTFNCRSIASRVTNVAPAAAATADDATVQMIMMTKANTMMITRCGCCGVSNEDAEIGRNEASSLSLFHISVLSPSSSRCLSLCLWPSLSFFLSLSLRANLG